MTGLENLISGNQGTQRLPKKHLSPFEQKREPSYNMGCGREEPTGKRHLLSCTDPKQVARESRKPWQPRESKELEVPG